MTWDEIYERADGCCWWDRELKAKDNARWNVRDLVYAEVGEDIEEAECPEERVDYYTELWDVEFDEDGHITSYKI